MSLPVMAVPGRASGGTVVDDLLERGLIWSPVPGVLGFRGAARELFLRLRDRIVRLTRSESEDEWLVPPALSLETLRRAEYFSSFPQWLTVASHLGEEEDALERVARAENPRTAVAAAGCVPSAALPPAACFHVYDALRDTTLVGGRRVLTVEGTCWRHEGASMRPLERGWAFTMREAVCLGSPGEVDAFRERMLRRGCDLARGLGLDARVVEATDPFYAPTARGKALLQSVKGLKWELLLPAGEGRRVAAASFNHHETFFGEAFGMRLPGGGPVSTGCAAFGLERWLLALLAAHGSPAAALEALAQPSSEEDEE
jgi:seryl-tRNA synthetase